MQRQRNLKMSSSDDMGSPRTFFGCVYGLWRAPLSATQQFAYHAVIQYVRTPYLAVVEVRDWPDWFSPGSLEPVSVLVATGNRVFDCTSCCCQSRAAKCSKAAASEGTSSLLLP